MQHRTLSVLPMLSLVYSMTRISAWADDSTKIDFVTDIQPILMKNCFSCHGQTNQKGGLRLDTSAGIKAGGATGPIIEVGKPVTSSLIMHVEGRDVERMPPKGDALSDTQIALLKTWISQGATSPENAAPNTQKHTIPWSFQPIVKPSVPDLPDTFKTWARTPVDAFILSKLLANNLHPSTEADKHVLARRVSIDLTGLPPTLQELETVLNDTSPDAYVKFVDRLLDSPRYGERWARHWLDIAHYADSHGQDQDRFRTSAWPYRDYVIRSFNDDKPYARFIREQIAGDVLYTDDSQALIATGFLAAGPWDESGLRDINENSIDREIARYLDRDDIVTSTMTTFAGLTVHCARCHDHKFDPITQIDYYALQSVFAGIDKAERTFDHDPAMGKKRASLKAEIARIKDLKDKADESILTELIQNEMAQLDAIYQSSEGQWFIPDPETWKANQGASLKALLDKSILSIGKAPERETYFVTISTDRVGITGLRLEVFPDEVFPMQGPGRAPNGNFHLTEVRIKAHPKGKPKESVEVKVKKATADFNQTDWEIAKSIDGNPQTAWGIHPEEGKPHQAVFAFETPVGFTSGTTFTIELDQLHGGVHIIGRFRVALSTSTPLAEPTRPTSSNIAAFLSIPRSKRTEAQTFELARIVIEQALEREFAALPPEDKIYCGTNKFAPSGSFKPAINPRPVHLLKRGEISRKSEMINPGPVAAVAGPPSSFSITDLNNEGQRRAALADWLADQANPLTWRVIVNRVWQHHFGKGIVNTPNDFGMMGGKPSHPELLDWLAAEFRDSGGSLKKLHKLIVLSNTYRQSVTDNSASSSKDASNRLLWRMNRSRLDAEGVRDTILQSSGRLDTTMFGPAVMHFVTKKGIHVTPEADYENFDVDAIEARRRSIYRHIFRTRPDPMLEALDCPDFSQSAPVRSESVSPIQALVLWNDKFVLRNAEHLARLAEQAGAEPSSRISFVSKRILGRFPTTEEAREWSAYVHEHGLPNLCRVLFNSSEFLFID